MVRFVRFYFYVAAGKFREFLNNRNGKLKIIGPEKEAMFAPMVDALGGKIEDVEYLDATDPNSILKWAIESVGGGKAATRKKGNSDPAITTK